MIENCLNSEGSKFLTSITFLNPLIFLQIDIFSISLSVILKLLHEYCDNSGIYF